MVGWIDGFVLPLVPKAYHPDRLLQDFLGLDPSMQFNVRGLGVVIFLIFTVMVGWAAKGLIGLHAPLSRALLGQQVGDVVYPFDDVEQASVAVAALEGME